MASTNNPERAAILRSGLRAEGLDACLAWFPEDLVMLAGTWPCLAMNLCLYPAEGQPVYYLCAVEPEDVCPESFLERRFAIEGGRWTELRGLLKADIARLGLSAIGVATDGGQHAVPAFSGESPRFGPEAIALILEGIGTLPATPFFTKAGLIKTKGEIELIRTANTVAAVGLKVFHDELRPGRSEAEVAALVEAAIQSHSGRDGCRLARAWAHVQAGPNITLGGTYSRSSAYRLAEGDLALIELGTCVDGYWSDLTRTSGVGRIGERQRSLLSAVRGAQAAAISAVRPGATHEEVDWAARDHLGRLGFGEGFTHGTGHHVGFRYHDRGPGLQKGNKEALAEGMVITVEPGSYGVQYDAGARFEDDVLVGADGAVLLSPRELSWSE